MLLSLLATLLLASTPAKPVADIPPPMTNGVFIDKGACPGEACALSGKLKWTQPVAVYDRPSSKARKIGALRANEWVEVVAREFHMAPTRGVVREPNGQAEQLARGDVVYIIGYQGEGWVELWRSGQRLSWAEPDIEANLAEIDWDTVSKTQPEPVMWVKVRRTKAASGWVRDFTNVRCGGQMDRDPDCPPLN
ncbi:hypothetical protein PQU92_06515 [Asticcacaulis sp. BYS171W]|uniref:SH3 domain-containing protein n=1 Tax=Asticcacaulis aquaticus TaxID=2984212 RepID=A0ABT5HS74_9CAUL|nr:hypothetical protein [Asticcacaulis aquaticus]MDC7682921.1 hypothetical protein [Asticcacaulis aquaticus]